MSRRGGVARRKIAPDEKFNNELIAKFISRMILKGKKSIASRIVYDALAEVSAQVKKDEVEVFQTAIKNVNPQVEVKSRRVGGATYQVPIEVNEWRSDNLAMRWIIAAARNRSGKSMDKCLAQELLDAYHKTGIAVKKKEEAHRMAEANKAFSHYRW